MFAPSALTLAACCLFLQYVQSGCADWIDEDTPADARTTTLGKVISNDPPPKHAKKDNDATAARFGPSSFAGKHLPSRGSGLHLLQVNVWPRGTKVFVSVVGSGLSSPRLRNEDFGPFCQGEDEALTPVSRTGRS